MSLSVPRVGAGPPEGRRGGVREAVLAGPGAAAALDELERSSLWDRLADSGAVRAALALCGHVDARRRVLTGEVTVQVVLGLGLFSGEGYDSVLAKVMPALAGSAPPGAGVPTGSALSQARARVDEKGLQILFQATAGEPTGEPVVGATEFGLELTAFDGTTFDLADTPAIPARFATPTRWRHPQARAVTLTACGTRKVRAAAAGSYATSEQELTDTLIDQLAPGTLNLADRNFFSMARFLACSATGAHLAWRVKNGNDSLPPTVATTPPHRAHLVRPREANNKLSPPPPPAGGKNPPPPPPTHAPPGP